MGFEKVTLANAEDCGIEGAYFAYGTMWIPMDGAGVENLVKLQSIYPDTVINSAGDEIAVDFVAPGMGKPIDRWAIVTV